MTGAKDNIKTKEEETEVAEIARAVNPAATRQTEGTTGGVGIDVCMAGCEETREHLARTSRKGEFYMLHFLGTAQCTKK